MADVQVGIPALKSDNSPVKDNAWSHNTSEVPWIFVIDDDEDEHDEPDEYANYNGIDETTNRMAEYNVSGSISDDGGSVPMQDLQTSQSHETTADIQEESKTKTEHISDGSTAHRDEDASRNLRASTSDPLPVESRSDIVANHRSPNHAQLLLSPSSGHSSALTPRSLRRVHSLRSFNDFMAPSPRVIKRSFLGASDYAASFHGDSISVINVPVHTEMTEQEKTQSLKTNLSKQLSAIYAIFLCITGGILYVGDQHGDKRIATEVFSSVIALMGMLWLFLLHHDLCKYKREVLKQLKQREDEMQEAAERFSTTTEYIINTGYAYTSGGVGGERENSQSSNETPIKLPPYLFLQGRHSGSFYLKIGMAAFCFGNLVYDGLQLGQHVLNFMDDEKKQLNCSRPTSVMLHTVLPLYAFYQLFITFKYSNIVINRRKALARFGLMHSIATCLCFWFNTIIEEAVEDYNQKSGGNVTTNTSNLEFDIASFHVIVVKKGHWMNPYHCTADSALSIRSMKAIPYLYPFAIEYNLLLAGVWYIVWQNIGEVSHSSDPHHLRHTISQDEGGGEAIAYQSNLVINADCHSANKGLFVGLFVMLTTIVTVIVFFVAITTDGYHDRAVSIHTGQEGALTFIGLLAIVVSFFQIRKLDINNHPITFLDDVLMFVPLPFYFLHGAMSVIAEYNSRSFLRLGVHILSTIGVIVQTPFILDGLRRCSNSQALRYKKPGREVITFLIILNLTLWIVNTFELKIVEKYHAQEHYFGDFIWMFIGHTTLPLMLFYRFHSSVCLADMWKSAYEKDNS